MKILLTISLLLIALASNAANFWTEWTMTVTNATTTNDAYTIQGGVRRGAGSRTSTTWVTNASPMVATTNVFSQFGGFPLAGVILSQVNSNVLLFRGTDIIMTISNNMGTLASNGFAISTNKWDLIFPVSAMPPTSKVSNATEVVRLLTGASSSEQIETNSTAMKSFMPKTNAVAVNLKVIGGSFTNVALTNATGEFHDTYSSAPVMKDAVETNTIAYGPFKIRKDTFGFALLDMDGEWVVEATAGGTFRIYNSDSGQVLAAWEYAGSATFPNPTVISNTLGVTLTLTASNAIIGNFRSTNSASYGTNAISGTLTLTPRAYSGAGNGYNSGISLGTNAFVRLSGPTAAWTNASFLAAEAGRVVLVEAANPTSSFTLLHHSAIGAPAANEQINTKTGALANSTNNPVVFQVHHNGTEWILDWLQ